MRSLQDENQGKIKQTLSVNVWTRKSCSENFKYNTMHKISNTQHREGDAMNQSCGYSFIDYYLSTNMSPVAFGNSKLTAFDGHDWSAPAAAELCSVCSFSHNARDSQIAAARAMSPITNSGHASLESQTIVDTFIGR
jgi:hypothetical protein